MNNKGFTLTEILITIGLAAILGAVATVSYRGYNVDIAKKDLKTHGILFANAVQNCITASGGWKIKHPAAANDMRPCYANDSDKLKSVLNYTCPTGATCNPVIHGRHHETVNKYKYYCLDIQKEVSGKKLQMLVRYTWIKPADYELWCGEMSSYKNIGNSNCRGSGDGITPFKGLNEQTAGLTHPCPWGNKN